MSIPIRTTFGYPELLRNLVKATFDSTADKALVRYRDVFRVRKGDDYDYKEQRMAGLGNAVYTPEGSNYHLDAPKYDDAKTLNPKKYTNGFRITKEMKMFNRVDLVAKLTKSLRKTLEECVDITVHRLYNNASNTTYCAGYDGLALASNSHTCLDDAGTTYDNYLAADLSVSGIESSLAYFAAVYDDQGNIKVIQPKKLVVPVAMQFKAFKLLESQNVPFEISNTKNVIGRWGLTPVVDERLSSSTAWFVIGDNNDDDFGALVVEWQQPKIYVKDAADRTLDTEVLGDVLFGYGLFDPRMIYVGNV